MADTMARFFGSLGAFAAPAVGLADCGCGLGATATGKTVDAAEAMSTILKQYADLSAQGERLRQILVAKGQVPCEVWAAYNQACLDYLAKSQPVFDQLASKNVVVEQVVYSAGQPVPDPNAPGQYRTLRVSAPLRPPGFGFTATACPGIATFQSAQDVGWVPVPVLGAVSASVLSALGTSAVLLLANTSGLALGTAGYGAYKTYQQVAIWLEAFYDSPARIVAAYTDCFEKSVKGGLSPERASATCANSQTSAQASVVEQIKAKLTANGWGLWTWVAVGGGVLVAGGLLALYLRGRVSRALGDGLGCDTNHPPVRPSRERKTRRKGAPLLLGDLYLHPRD
jgi:hypothetical protein